MKFSSRWARVEQKNPGRHSLEACARLAPCKPVPALSGLGRGCIEDHRFLHFEARHYQAIEFAIKRGLKREKIR